MPIFKKRYAPVGSRPGTLVVPEGSLPVRTRVMSYRAGRFEESTASSPGETRKAVSDDEVTWIDFQSLGTTDWLLGVGEAFGIHSLTLSDIVEAPQRPKTEEHPEYLFLITRMARFADDALDIEQVAILVRRDCLLTFQEHYGDVLDPVRERIREGIGPIRNAGTDYLAYALVDTIIDGYYPVIETLSARIEKLNERAISRPTPKVLDGLYRAKAELLMLRRGLFPQREALNRLVREPGKFVSDEVRVYLRDTCDHCAQLVDIVDSHRELIDGSINTYLSVVSNRTNEIMKVLTIMASIFIPLTFMAGIYGMNFDNMPELSRPWAYPVLMAVMALTAGGMLFYFWHKGWIGGGDDDDLDDVN